VDQDRQEGLRDRLDHIRRGRGRRLCWGWISSHRKALDGTYFLQKYTPRRPNSRWSKVNIAKVAALTRAGRMRPPGQAEVDAAIADGRAIAY
jgi:uncharacterized protein YdeI (YjbR/CyaY-like superfamily)